MMDPRIERLADTLVGFSTAVKAGDNVLISATNDCEMLVTALVRAVYRAGATPFVWLNASAVERALAMGYTQAQLDLRAQTDAALMEQMQCYIGFSAIQNNFEMADVPAANMNLYGKQYGKRVHTDLRVPKTRWCVLRYPTRAMAQMASMSTEQFEDFYFDVCTMDYSKMERAMQPLVDLMEKTDRVRIVGAGTDLSFSIKGMPAIPCAGRMNIPDGEVFTAPVKDSVNGVITYNTPSTLDGFRYEQVRLTFRDGAVIDAQANDTARIQEVFKRDAGARYVGEFAIGVNPFITTPMDNTLFDEKIMGSFHFTPGSCYEECDNGNQSALHWDLVCIQTPAFGGGEMYFDDVLVRKDGRFVLEELDALNPENLR
ncbi:MAG: aminopeptidase [Christensenellales bacterium]|jgi:aminopeptidase